MQEGNSLAPFPCLGPASLAILVPGMYKDTGEVGDAGEMQTYGENLQYRSS